jgi:transcriptional regulator with XRE-family HTH domain
MKLHEKIYRLRTEKKLSQGDLAEILDVSRQSVSKWETGASVPDLDKLIKMSNLFGVTIDFLVREEIDPIHEAIQKQEEHDANSFQHTVIVKESFPLRKLFGALFFISAFVLLFIVWPLAVFAAVLGVICFVFQKHTLLWCAWFSYFSLDIFMVTGTGINRGAVFLPHAYSIYGLRILVDWAYLLLLIVLIALTVYTFRRVQYDITPRRKIGFALGWFVAFGILPLINFILSGWIGKKLTELTEATGGVFTVGSELYKQHRFYLGLMGKTGFICEWIQIIALPILLIVTVSWIHMRKKRNGKCFGICTEDTNPREASGE